MPERNATRLFAVVRSAALMPGNCAACAPTMARPAEPERRAREPAGEVVGVDLDLLQASAELELVVAGHIGRVSCDLVGPRVAPLRLKERPSAGGVERARDARHSEEDPAAEIDVAFERDRRQVAANPQLVLKPGRRRPAPRPREALRGIGEDERPRRRE